MNLEQIKARAATSCWTGDDVDALIGEVEWLRSVVDAAYDIALRTDYTAAYDVLNDLRAALGMKGVE